MRINPRRLPGTIIDRINFDNFIGDTALRIEALASSSAASVAGLPLVVPLDEDGAGKPEERGGVGEHADAATAA